ncbi:hypothetical protein D3C72_421270 [compost metagenome]
MKRWNISQLILYSHDNRRSEIQFDLEAVNIITGESQTGKSAVPEIIDYVTGSSECHIPAFVRESLSWVGLLWVRGETQVLLIRKVPRGAQKKSDRYYVDYGQRLAIPANKDAIEPTVDIDGALGLFERQLGIGNAKTETFGEGLRSQHRVSIRHAMPFVLMTEEVIINKATLLKNTDDSKRRQGILDSIPYYLGIVDESFLDLEVRLRSLKRYAARLEKDLQIAGLNNEDGLEQVKGLLRQAATLGMLPGPLEAVDALPADEARRLLNAVSQWDGAELPVARDDRRLELQADYERLLAQDQQIRRALRAARRDIEARDRFEGTLNRQKNRLEVVHLFKNVSDTGTCPLCDHVLSEEHQQVKVIHQHLDTMRGELASVDRGRPRLDEHILKLQGESASVQTQLDHIREQLAGLNRVENEIAQANNMTRARLKFAVRAETYLETHPAVVEAGPNPLALKLEQLRSEIAQQEEQLDNQSKLVAFENAEYYVADRIKQVVDELPFGVRYRERPIYLDLREAVVGVRMPHRNEIMRDLGSDENYLSLHVGAGLAFHRYFHDHDRPVPGVIVFDQLSRPYFPEEREIIEMEDEAPQDDRGRLATYFDVLFNEVERGESLQVIVLEHAYFREDPRYVQAVKRKWRTREGGLIPNGWPQLN